MNNELKVLKMSKILTYILDLIKELRSMGIEIAINNKISNKYILKVKLNDNVKEYVFFTYKDIVNTLEIIRDLESESGR